MPGHKMVTIGGIRVRAEDVDRYHALRGLGAEPARPLTLTDARLSGAKPDGTPQSSEPPQSPDVTGLFDPAEHDVPTVLAHLAGADQTETERVLAAEAAGKNRKTILGKEPT